MPTKRFINNKSEDMSKDKIQSFLEAIARPVSLKEIKKYLGVEKKEMVSLLKDMEEEGLVVRIKNDRYGLPSRTNQVTGKLSCNPSGFGFVLPLNAEEEDIYIRQNNMNDAMHGDKVVARVDRYKKGGKREGKIVRILERGNKQIIGRIERYKKRFFLIPEDSRIFHTISLEKEKSLRKGDIAVAEIVQFPSKRRNPKGKIKEVLGDPFDPDVEVKSIIYKFDLPHIFPKNCVKEAESVSKEIIEEDKTGKEDLRELHFVTIDGENARDFDDAVYIERDGQSYKLWVAIADVSHYVREKSALDREAYTRGTSVYFPDRAIPMLPEVLSNGICSLKPGVERFALTVKMNFDESGKLHSYQFYNSIIKSRKRLTYSEVRDIVEGNTCLDEDFEELTESLKIMEKLARILMKKRFKEGSIDFDLPEAEIILDIRGKTEDIIRSERNIAHRIIEEFMLVTNRTVAHHLLKRELPLLNRVHEEPEKSKIQEFREFIANFGYKLEDGLKHLPKAFQKLLTELEGKPEEKMINRVMLRSMKQARYATKNIGHFGLAFKHYAHFTSPIRRYPDLVVHRILKETMKDEGIAEEKVLDLNESLPIVADHTSQRERIAMDAERDIVDLKKVQFMADKVGETFEGFITSVISFGFFVELEEYLIDGLVHISSIQDDYYLYLEKEHAFIGEKKRKRYRIGDMVKVRVDRVNIARRQVDFILVKLGIR